MASQSPPQIDLKPSFGALYIGVLTSIGLLGITTLQTWLYYSYFPKDRRILRFTVFLVWVLEFLHSAFGAHALYHYVILNWGNPLALGVSLWSLDITLLITAIVESIVRAFFMWRVYIVSDNKWYFPAVIGFFGLCAFSFTVATYTMSVTAVNFSKFGQAIYVISSTSLAASIAADVTISALLAYFLNSKRTGFSKTNTLLNRLIFFAINIGLATTLTDIAVLTCSSTLKGSSLVYLSIYEVVSKLYANSLLATLNIREADRESYTESSDSAFRMSEIRRRHIGNGDNSNNTRFASGTLVREKTRSSAALASGVVTPSNGKLYAYDVHVPHEAPSGNV